MFTFGGFLYTLLDLSLTKSSVFKNLTFLGSFQERGQTCSIADTWPGGAPVGIVFAHEHDCRLSPWSWPFQQIKQKSFN